jgi:hypothetical protein
MNQALAMVQHERPDVTVSFTLMVQGEDYGLTLPLGVDVLVNAKKNNVRVDIVNAMAMEYPKMSATWGESIVNVTNATLYQMKEIWPEKSETELKQMLGKPSCTLYIHTVYCVLHNFSEMLVDSKYH